ncbi:MAG TPA: LUD domain-containing protein [Gaiellaceae bacterium]|nr:LUD domain-containing protein [Gaiellaceae bacterium]
MNARDEILARVAEAIGGADPAAELKQAYRRSGELSDAERVERFCERVGEYQADVRRVEGMIAAAVDTVCTEREVERLVIPPALPAAWRPRTVELVEDDGLEPRVLDELGGALTGCTAAVAETGTIVLTAAPFEGRRAITLVPDLHICVVRESQVYELLPETLDALHRAGLERRPITFISGPSATSDIELSRVEGVHGPRQLTVLVTKERP